MMEDDNRKLDKHIRDNIETERPTLDFSDKIMQQIFLAEAKKEKALGTLVQKYALEAPPKDFTKKVMNQILKENSSVFVYKPVIGKKVWFSIGFVLSLILIYGLADLDYKQTQFDYFYMYLLKFDSIFSFQLPEGLFSPIFTLSLFTLSLFLVLDFFIQNSGNPHKTNVV